MYIYIKSYKKNNLPIDRVRRVRGEEGAGSRGRGEADAGRGEEGKQTERRRGGVGGGVARRRICTGREREVRREMHVRRDRSKERERLTG